MSRKHPLSAFPSTVESRPAGSEETHMMGCELTPSATLVPSQAGWAPPRAPNAMGYPQPPPMPQSQPPQNMQPRPISQPPQGYNMAVPYGYAPYQAPPGHYHQPNHPYHPQPWMMPSHGMHPQHPMVYYPQPTASQKRQALKKSLPVLHSNARAQTEGKGGEGPPTQTAVTSAQGKTLNEVFDSSLSVLAEEIDQSAEELLLRDDMSLDESLSDLLRVSSHRSSLHEAYEALEQDARALNGGEGGGGYQQQLQQTHMSIDSICHALQPIPVGGKSEWSSSMNTNQTGGYPPSGRMG